MRVLQVARRYFPEQGGMETHVSQISSRLAARPGVEVTVLATDRTGQLPRRATMDGYDVLRRRSWPRTRDYYLSPGIAPVSARGGWDIVHLQGVNTLVPVVGMLAAIAGRVPFVLSLHSGGHSSGLRTASRGLQWHLMTPLLRRAARLIAVSRFERDHFARATGIPPGRFAVIPKGGELPPVARGIRPGPGRIVSMGRLERYKGHGRVIEALPLIRRQHPDAHLVVLGEGPCESELRALAHRLGVSEVVHWRSVPPQDRQVMAGELGSAVVMAAMSDYEAHPIGVMEALAAGVPVTGCDIAGIGDLVQEGLVDGVAPGADSAAVACALIAALERSREAGHPEHRPGSIRLPTWDQAAEQTAQIYDQVLGLRLAAAQ